MGKFNDLTGQKFGRLTVVSLSPERTKRGKTQWLCRCDCGEEKNTDTNSLKSGHTSSCGCATKELLSNAQLKDIAGQKFGRLIVVSLDGMRKNKSYWLCHCECGTQKVIGGQELRRKQTSSCGCLQRELISRRTLIDLTGQKFGRLTVVSLSPERTKGNNARWMCLCECGVQKVVGANGLKTGQTQSCGCLSAQQTQTRHTKFDSTRALQAQFGSLVIAARDAGISAPFLGSIAAGRKKCDRTYHRVKRHVLGEATPDGRRRRIVNCAGCNAAIWARVIDLNRGVVPACAVCVDFVATGGRAKPLTLPHLMDAPKPKKERKRNRETVEIERLVKVPTS